MELIRLDDCRWEIPPTGGMRVPVLIFADDILMAAIKGDQSLKQAANVAHLPGILGRSLAMPDMLMGYGFPIGGVAAFDMDEGVISPGGVGYDINCGVRVMTTGLEINEVRPYLKTVVEGLYRDIPTGLGKGGRLKLSQKELRKVLTLGSAWAVKNGFGAPADLDHTEEHGAMAGADPDLISPRALERGRTQVGTLGSGNHFVEISRIDKIFDKQAADVLGLFMGQVLVMVHTGSRGLGHQVCTDFLKNMVQAGAKAGITLPDRQLTCVPIRFKAGQNYLAAMAAAANFAWANRQVIMHKAEESLEKSLGIGPADLKMRLVYDVAHNIAKIEKHRVDGREREVVVHRKGATRSFPPGHADVPDDYKSIGQPVLIPGDMGRASFILAGDAGAMEESFGSSCHGAGRVLSRTAARKKSKGRSIVDELAAKGIEVRFTGRNTLAEEIPEAYKDVERVVDVVQKAGLARKVVRMRPVGVIKG
ncbi:MAG: RtcB family protein [Deltaproteobacteria bacterium]|nr:RtcB family protein [Deltaproteobacteria bacterium]